MKKLLSLLLIGLVSFSAFGAGIDAYTVAMLHNDGTDGSQVFTDNAITPHTFTASGQAQIDDAQFVFGQSGYFDGTGDYLDSVDSADWFMGTGNFTIDFRYRFAEVKNYTIWVEQWLAAGNQQSFQFYHEDDSTLHFVYSPNGLATTDLSVAWAPALTTWYHIAVVRNGADLMFFINGTQQGATQNIGANNVFDSNDELYILALDGTAYGKGWIDELRISKGIARWTSNFSLPTEAYSLDAGGNRATTMSNTGATTISLNGATTISQ